MTKKKFFKICKTLEKVITEVAQESMSDAATDIKEKTDSAARPVDISVSVDGSWQKRGFSSLNGNVAAISLKNGKVLDVEPMSRNCRLCKSKEKLKAEDPDAYDLWFKQHEKKCSLNYQGSAGGMEVAGAQAIFSRSIEKHQLRYVKYLGDGDSKSFSNIEKVYDNIDVEKLECVGHVQKRVGKHLRNLKESVKGLGGPGKLTDKKIDRLQNYYV